MINTVTDPDSGNTCLMLSVSQLTEETCAIKIHRL